MGPIGQAEQAGGAHGAAEEDPAGPTCGASGVEEAEEQEWEGPPHQASSTTYNRPGRSSCAASLTVPLKCQPQQARTSE